MRDLLAGLVSEIRTVLGPDLIGVYLYGSYVSGGFDPAVSDLDLVAVTARDVEQLDLAGLERMHRDLASRDPEWDDRIEVVYVGQAALSSFRTSPGPLAVISPGEPFHLRDDRIVEWLQNWYLVRETGDALYGPAASVVVPPIDWAEYVDATVRYAVAVGQHNYDDDSPGSIAYAALTMCRALLITRTQRQASKQEAAAWTRARMPEWAPVIDTALRCRLARGASGFDDLESRGAAASFIRCVAAQLG